MTLMAYQSSQPYQRMCPTKPPGHLKKVQTPKNGREVKPTVDPWIMYY